MRLWFLESWSTKKSAASVDQRPSERSVWMDALHLFSDFDLASVRKLPDAPKHQATDASPFEWYAAHDRVDPQTRRRIEEYFEEPDTSCPDDLNFDRLRRRSRSPLPEQVPQEVQEP